MTYYAGIGAVHIQSWLARTANKLFLVRGGSALLSEQTSAERITEVLGAHPAVRLAGAAGDIDGVVALECAQRAPLEAACRAVLGHLERAVVGLEWEAWLAEGDDYSHAYIRNGGGRWLASRPALPELGLVQTCAFCGLEPAVESITHGDEPPARAGLSCAQRHRAYQEQQRRNVQQRDGRRRSDWAEIRGEWPKEFDQLARTTTEGVYAVGRRDSRGHLATVAADGNGIGELFRVISESGDARLREVAVRLLDEQTKEAVVAAARACEPPGGQPETKIVAPHYVGGDDVLLSVPAPLAWRFAAELGKRFEGLRERLSDDSLGADEKVRAAVSRLGLGIGIAFARESHPIGRTTQAAHRALAAAKRCTRGGESAIGWVDLTAAEDECYTITVADARAELDGEPCAVFRLGASARGTLGTILRSGLTEADEKVRQWTKRTGNTLGEQPPKPRELAALLSRARWWPDVPVDGDDDQRRGEE